MKSSNYPDPEADRGEQRITWSYWLHDGIEPLSAGIEEAAAGIAHPLRTMPVARGLVPVEIVTCDVPGAVVEVVKRAEDGSGDVIVRRLGEPWRPRVRPARVPRRGRTRSSRSICSSARSRCRHRR